MRLNNKQDCLGRIYGRSSWQFDIAIRLDERHIARREPGSANHPLSKAIVGLRELQFCQYH
jgi:hypothetical protein